MKYRNSVFIVVYSRQKAEPLATSSKRGQSKVKNKIEYLVLKRKLHWNGWEFPKGGIDSGETRIGAVKREIKEETGLKILKIKKFNISGKFKYNKKFPDRQGFIGQKYSLYSVLVKKSKIKLDRREHSDYKWLGFIDAVKKLTWKNQRKCLKIVNEWLNK